MTYTPNGLNDRIDWVLRTYAKRPVVAYETLRMIASAIGMDAVLRSYGRSDMLRDTSWYATVMPTGMEENAEVNAGLVEELRDALQVRPEERTAVDPIVPWMAATIAGVQRAYERSVSEYLWLEEREGAKAASAQVALRAATDSESRLRRAIYVLQHRGAAIAMWAREERPDLTRMDWREVHDAVKAWGDERRQTQPVPQGDVVYEWADGWTVQLLGIDALEVEGEVMQHCVGGYCDVVGSGAAAIYSLRDPKGRPHVTIEYNPKTEKFEQIMGKQNTRPAPQYAERVIEWLQSEFPTHIAAQLMAGRTNFQGADLRGADFQDEVANQCNFDGADFGLVGPEQRTYLGSYARFEWCTFRGADFQDAVLMSTFLSCDFTDADLRDAFFDGTFFGGKNVFTDALLDGVKWKDVRPKVPDELRAVSPKPARTGAVRVPGAGRRRG